VLYSPDPNNGSCWVADMYTTRLSSLQRDGTEVLRLVAMTELRLYGVNPPIAVLGRVANSTGTSVVHFASDGPFSGRVPGTTSCRLSP